MYKAKEGEKNIFYILIRWYPFCGNFLWRLFYCYHAYWLLLI